MDEEWATPADTSMELESGVVFRRSMAEVIESRDQRRIDALKEHIAQMKLFGFNKCFWLLRKEKDAFG